MNPSEFLRSAQTGLMHHAYILYGEDVKTAEETAQKIANFFEHGAFKIPAGLLGESLLVRPIEETIGIDEVRGIKHFLAQKTALSAHKTVIIVRAECMTLHAQNALLKIMEEPPEYARIFLVVSQKERVLPTVRSRANAVHFPSQSAPQKKFDIAALQKLISRGADSEDEIDNVLSSLLDALRSEPVKNFSALRETVKRVTAIKQFNTNRKLQLRAIYNSISGLS